MYDLLYLGSRVICLIIKLINLSLEMEGLELSITGGLENNAL